MKQIIGYILAIILLAACGGSGGGSTDSESYTPVRNPVGPDEGTIVPVHEFEPYGNGEAITHNGNNWTIELDNTVFSLNASEQLDNIYIFDNQNHELGQISAIAAANGDVDLFAMILSPHSGGEPSVGFGMQGNFNASPSFITRYFSGQYTSMTPNGEVQGNWDMEVYIDLNNISNSYAIDTAGGDIVSIHFVDINADAISGTISDLNHDFHLVSFGLFGDNAQTIAGGYANELGAGMLIAED